MFSFYSTQITSQEIIITIIFEQENTKVITGLKIAMKGAFVLFRICCQILQSVF